MPAEERRWFEDHNLDDREGYGQCQGYWQAKGTVLQVHEYEPFVSLLVTNRISLVLGFVQY